MDNDKITISMDEVERATPVPGSSPTPYFTPGFATPHSEPPTKPNRIGLNVGICIAVFALLCLAGIGIAAAISGKFPGRYDEREVKVQERTTDDVKAEVRRELEDELSSSSSSTQQLKQRIEKAHITVTVTSTEVKRVDVETVDGTDRAGKNDENIKTMTILIRFNWQGIFKSGFTDLEVVHDAINDRTESKIAYTTADFNTEDAEFWVGVGTLVGTVLFGEE